MTDKTQQSARARNKGNDPGIHGPSTSEGSLPAESRGMVTDDTIKELNALEVKLKKSGNFISLDYLGENIVVERCRQAIEVSIGSNPSAEDVSATLMQAGFRIALIAKFGPGLRERAIQGLVQSLQSDNAVLGDYESEREMAAALGERIAEQQAAAGSGSAGRSAYQQSGKDRRRTKDTLY